MGLSSFCGEYMLGLKKRDDNGGMYLGSRSLAV